MPRLVHILLSLIQLIGIGFIILTLQGILPAYVPLVCIYFLLKSIGESGYWLLANFIVIPNFAASAIFLANPKFGFSKEHLERIITAILTTSFGLGGAIYSGIYKYLFAQYSISAFFLLQFILVGALMIFGVPFVTVQDAQPEECLRKGNSRSFLKVLLECLKNPSFWLLYCYIISVSGFGTIYIR